MRDHLKELFEREHSVLKALFGNYSKKANKKGYSVEEFKHEYYFIEYLPVSPNRFRPESVVNDQVYLHAHTLLYTKVIQINNELTDM